MTFNKLKLNPDKTEFVLIGSPHKREELSDFFPLDLLGSPLSPHHSAKNLGFTFDSDLNLSSHIAAVSKACFLQIRDLCRIRRYLNKKALILLGNALVSSKIDYCNSLFSSLTDKNLRRLQSIQNTLCRVICRLPRRASTSKFIKSLHWLPVSFRIKFKICVQVYKTLDNGQPLYIKD